MGMTATDEYLDHYLCSLAGLLGPIEELEQSLQSQLASITFLENQLRKLEEQDWVVVFEEDVPLEDNQKRDSESKRNKDSLHATLLSERDYSSLIIQFQLSEFFSFVISHFSKLIESGQDTSGSLLRLFSTTHHLTLILLRGIHILPRKYENVFEHLASTLIFVLETLNQHIIKWTSQQSNLAALKIIVEGHHTTVTAEWNGLVARTYEHFIKIRNRNVWKALPLFPIKNLSISTKNMILKNILGELSRFDEKPESFSEKDLNYLIESSSLLLQSQSSILPDSGKGLEWKLLCKRALRKVFSLEFLPRPFGFSELVSLNSLHENCSRNPQWLSDIMQWIRDDWQHIQSKAIFEFVGKIPWTRFEVRQSDLLLLQGMIRDPQGSLKPRLAMYILNNLNWGYRLNSANQKTNELFIPRHLHRSLAVFLINIYLDRNNQESELPSILSNMTSRVANKALDSMGRSGDSNYSFETWIWYDNFCSS
jgi:hypothetical protein